MASLSRRLRERLGGLALLLWLPVVVVGGWSWSRGNDPPEAEPSNGRTMLELRPDEHETLQSTMRHNVEALDSFLRAWSEGDRAAMAAAARSIPADTPAMRTPSLRQSLPPEWRALGDVVHRELDTLATDLDAGLPDAEIPGRLAEVTAACVACHRQFQYRAVKR